jgi:hypothetical protein
MCLWSRTIFDTLIVTQTVKCVVSFLCYPRNRQLSRDISADACFQYDKAVAVGDAIKGT